MEKTGNRLISGHELFPVLKEALKNGQKVKFTVSGNSMLPWISHNRDHVLLAGIKDRKLRLGDIILFKNRQDKYLLHRIYRIDAKGYYTIGDANLTGDGPVLAGDILGVVEKIYRKGKVIDCGSFFWHLVFSFWRISLPVRKQLLSQYKMAVRIKGSLSDAFKGA